MRWTGRRAQPKFGDMIPVPDIARVEPLARTSPSVRPIAVPAWIRTTFRLAASVAPRSAVSLARRLLFRPPRARLRADEREVLETALQFTVSVDGGRVAGYAWGAGPTLLLVHGWGGHAGHMTSFVVPAVAAGFRVVALDLPAHGTSDGRVASLVHFARALERAGALVGPLRGVIAHSLGAAATTYAISRGLPAGRAAFLAPASRFGTMWDRFKAGLGVPEDVFEQVLRDSEAWLGVQLDGLEPVALAPAMTTPLLVLHAEDDREVACEEGAELAARWPGAVFRRLGGVGHRRILRHGPSIEAAVAFVARGEGMG
jgi:pimeloyl-ACP methyl ester carboxylesterase